MRGKSCLKEIGERGVWEGFWGLLSGRKIRAGGWKRKKEDGPDKAERSVKGGRDALLGPKRPAVG